MLPDVKECSLGLVDGGDIVKNHVDAWEERGECAWTSNDETKLRISVEDAIKVEAQYGHWRREMC